jgi:putative PIG3 family NAD(P)H quinone oxidoreductase
MQPILPQKMQIIEITQPGAPDVLALSERDVPVAGEYEILVRVHAAGVNRPDVAQRLGHYPPPPGASDIPGLEIAGEVIATGNGTSRYKIGDKVCALVTGGGYAEIVAVHETNALPLPHGYSYEEAACIPETFFTVWHNVFERGGLKKGEVFLVHGGTSGIGTTAIQLAKAFGAFVITTAGSDEKCAACLKIGADIAINYKTQDFVEAINTATNGQGADVILDMVGGDYVDRNFKAAAIDGRIVQIAFLNGIKSNINLVPLVTKRLTHTGSTLRARSVAFKAGIAAALEEQVWPLLESRKVVPIMDESFALKDAKLAHQHMEDGNHIGKIVLKLI